MSQNLNDINVLSLIEFKWLNHGDSVEISVRISEFFFSLQVLLSYCWITFSIEKIINFIYRKSFDWSHLILITMMIKPFHIWFYTHINAYCWWKNYFQLNWLTFSLKFLSLRLNLLLLVDVNVRNERTHKLFWTDELITSRRLDWCCDSCRSS